MCAVCTWILAAGHLTPHGAGEAAPEDPSVSSRRTTTVVKFGLCNHTLNLHAKIHSGYTLDYYNFEDQIAQKKLLVILLVIDTNISTSKNFSELQAKPHPGKTNRKLAQIKVLQGQLPKYYAVLIKPDQIHQIFLTLCSSHILLQCHILPFWLVGCLIPSLSRGRTIPLVALFS